MADSTIFSDRDLSRYLLGDLGEPELIRLEEQSICDPQFFERIQMAEEELIRKYLDRKLSRTDETLFRDKYFSTSELRRKVEFVEGLRRLALEELSSQRQRSPYVDFFRWPRVVFPLAAGAAAVILATAIFTFHGHSPHQQKSGQASSDRQPPQSNVVSLMILPGIEKGAASRDHRLVIAQDTTEIHLQLQVPGHDAPDRADVDVVRVAVPADEKRASQTVEGRSTVAGRSFMVVLKPGALPEGSYIAYLRRWPASAHPEPEESFVFSVVR